MQIVEFHPKGTSSHQLRDISRIRTWKPVMFPAMPLNAGSTTTLWDWDMVRFERQREPSRKWLWELGHSVQHWLLAAYLISLFRGSDVSLVLWSCRCFGPTISLSSSHKMSKKSQYRIFSTCLCPRTLTACTGVRLCCVTLILHEQREKGILDNFCFSLAPVSLLVLLFWNFVSNNVALSPFTSAMKQWNWTLTSLCGLDFGDDID